MGNVAWKNLVLTGLFDDTTPAKTVTAVANLNLATMDLSGGVFQVTVTFGASADGDATVKWYYSADGGTTVSLERTDTVTVSAGNDVNTNVFRVMRQPFLRVTVTNGNTAVEDITLALTGACLQHGAFAS